MSSRLDRARDALGRNVGRTLERDRVRVTRAAERLRAGPRSVVERAALRLARAHERLRLAPLLAVERKRAVLDKTAAQLGALSPLQTLQRGYAIVRTESGDVVASAGDVSVDTRVDVTLADGEFGARVEEVTP